MMINKTEHEASVATVPGEKLIVQTIVWQIVLEILSQKKTVNDLLTYG
jgi:hypothetical protein